MGQLFLADIQPFIWRRTFDYTVMDDMKMMLRRPAARDITEQALAQIEESGQTNKTSTVVYDPNWHKGVCSSQMVLSP